MTLPRFHLARSRAALFVLAALSPTACGGGEGPSAAELRQELETAQQRLNDLQGEFSIAQPRMNAYLALEFMGQAEALHAPQTRLVIRSTSPVPDPKTVEYPDCLAMHVCEIVSGGDAQAPATGEALVAFAVLDDRRPLVAASFEEGTEVEAFLVPFNKMPAEVRSMQRSDSTDAIGLEAYAAVGAHAIGAMPAGVPTKHEVHPTERTALTREEEIAASIATIEGRLAAHGNTWQAWEQEMRACLKALDDRRKKEDLPFRDGEFMFRYFSGVRRPKKQAEHNFDWPDAQIRYFKSLHQQLASRGIDLIVVPFPPMEEIAALRMVPDPPADGIVDPQRQRVLLQLLHEGVEVLDILPDLIEASDEGPSHYAALDGHPNDLGVRTAAHAIAERLRRYGFPREFDTLTQTVRYGIPEEHQRFPESARAPDAFEAVQVLDPDGRELPSSVDQSPILVCCDSYGNVPRYYKVKSADIPAHLAKELGVIPHRFSLGGGGGRMMVALKKAGLEVFKDRKVCVYLFREGYLYLHSEEQPKYAWQVVDLFED